MDGILLFNQKGELFKFLRNIKQNIKREVESYDHDYILNVSEEDFYQYLFSKYSLSPLKIYEDKIYISE